MTESKRHGEFGQADLPRIFGVQAGKVKKGPPFFCEPVVMTTHNR